jgi:hypothetical protein
MTQKQILAFGLLILGLWEWFIPGYSGVFQETVEMTPGESRIVSTVLGPVDNQLEAMRSATRFRHAAKLQSVLSYLVAIRLNSLIFAK